MREPRKILIVSQHFPPDVTTTATYVGDIARALPAEHRVVVLSASPNSATAGSAHPQVIEIASPAASKDALARRAIAIVQLAIRMFVATLRRAERQDAVFCV